MQEKPVDLLAPLSWSILASVLMGAAPAASQVTLDAPRARTIGEFPHSLVAADFDEDGHLDLASSERADSVRLLLNDGTGRFASERRFASAGDGGLLSYALVVDDFDEDGHADVARIDEGVDSVSIFLGDGAGGLLPPRTFSVEGHCPVAMIAADIDEDGHLDLAVSKRCSPSVTLLLGDGDGGFAFSQNLPARQAGALVAVDLNEDGHLDLCITGVTNTGVLFVYLGDGSGGFILDQTLTLTGIFALAVIDANEDGNADLFVSREGASHVLFIGDGTGGLSAPQSVAGPGGRDSSIAVIDLNGDAHADVVCSGILVFLGDGAGSFTGFSVRIGNGLPLSLAAGDFDEDGRVDVATVDEGEDPTYEASLTLLHGTGSGNFTLARNAALAGGDPRSVTAVDLDGDGHLDLATADSITDSVSVLLGHGDAEFAAAEMYRMGEAPRSVRAADLDGDGVLDLVAANEGGASVTVRLGVGAGAFDSPMHFPVGTGPRAVIVAEFDGDGRRDLVTANFMSQDLTLLLGDGTGNFASPMPIDVGGGRPSSVITGDFDEDGRFDLAVAKYFDFTVRVLRGDGDGGFGDALDLAAGENPVSLTAADFDDDGHLDLAVANEFGNSVSVFLGSGSGAFSSATNVSLRESARALTNADLDGDGDRDLVVTSGVVSVLRNDGSGAFLLDDSFGPGGSGVAVTTGDFDEDGFVDVATAKFDENQVGLLLNRSFDPIACRRGNVNYASGSLRDVLFVNDSSGSGAERKVIVDRMAPLVIRIDAPPSLATASFACFAWRGTSTDATTRLLPRDVGWIGMPIRLHRSVPQPVRVANNLGFEGVIGVESWPGPPTTAAPTTLLSLAGGSGRSGTFFLQGIIRDPASRSGVVAVTNGIEVQSQ